MIYPEFFMDISRVFAIFCCGQCWPRRAARPREGRLVAPTFSGLSTKLDVVAGTCRLPFPTFCARPIIVGSLRRFSSFLHVISLNISLAAGLRFAWPRQEKIKRGQKNFSGPLCGDRQIGPFFLLFLVLPPCARVLAVDSGAGSLFSDPHARARPHKKSHWSALCAKERRKKVVKVQPGGRPYLCGQFLLARRSRRYRRRSPAKTHEDQRKRERHMFTRRGPLRPGASRVDGVL